MCGFAYNLLYICIARRMVFWEEHRVIYSRINQFYFLYYYFICGRPHASTWWILDMDNDYYYCYYTSHALIEYTKLSILYFSINLISFFGWCACTMRPHQHQPSGYHFRRLRSAQFTHFQPVITRCRKIDTHSRQRTARNYDKWCVAGARVNIMQRIIEHNKRTNAAGDTGHNFARGFFCFCFVFWNIPM